MLHNLKKGVHRRLRKIAQKEHTLSYLFWECTQRCNLKCLHCGSDCISSSQYKDMPKDDFISVLKNINQFGQKHDPSIVVITGGEPLLRKDLEECGLEIRKNDFRWGIVSNGYQYTAQRHRSLLSAGMGAITFSLDGIGDSHNWLRDNAKSYDRVVEAIGLVSTSDRLNFDIVTCVNKKNIHQLEDIYNLLLAQRAKAWRLFTITPIGRAKDNDQLALSASEMKYLMIFIAEKRKLNQIDVKFSCEGYTGSFEGQVRSDYFFCRAGINIASVLIDGSIGACPNVNRSFVQGNIYTDSFWDVWENKYEMYRDRSWTKVGMCATCKEYKNCEGNGLHYWTEQRDNPLTCHYRSLV